MLAVDINVNPIDCNTTPTSYLLMTAQYEASLKLLNKYVKIFYGELLNWDSHGQ